MKKKKKNTKRKWLLGFLLGVIILPYIGLYVVKQIYNNKLEGIANARFVIVDKEQMKLFVIDYNGNMIRNYGIACGKNYGDKNERGDMKTPEGIFCISDIEDASTWGHDFKDGKGKIAGAYGPWFIRLATPGHKGIGIHGTHDPNSIGTRATEGCIRLKNEDVDNLKQLVNVGMTVIILPSYSDLSETQKDSLKNFTRGVTPTSKDIADTTNVFIR